jgi:hypothetical protein
MEPRLRVWAAGALSVGVGGALLVLAGRALEWEELGRWWGGTDRARVAGAMVGYVGLFGVVHLLRLWRWKYLLGHLGDFKLGAILRATAVGSAAILLLPLRLGELVRPYALSRETGCAMSAALGAAVVERVVDGLCIALLLFATLATYEGGGSTAFVGALGWLALAVFSGALGVCLLALWRRAWTLSVLRGLLSRVSVGLALKVEGLLGDFLDGVQGLRQGRSLLGFLAMTLGYWGLNGASIAFLAKVGFELPLGVWDGMTVLAILVVGIMIPAGPALAGNYEWFTLQALGLFASPAQVGAQGAACVAAMHALQFLVQVLPGVVLAWGRGGVLGLRREAQGAAQAGGAGGA